MNRIMKNGLLIIMIELFPPFLQTIHVIDTSLTIKYGGQLKRNSKNSVHS